MRSLLKDESHKYLQVCNSHLKGLSLNISRYRMKRSRYALPSHYIEVTSEQVG